MSVHENRPLNAMLAPSDAKRRAIALPIPREAPVTSATFPSNIFFIVVFVLLVYTSNLFVRDKKIDFKCKDRNSFRIPKET